MENCLEKTKISFTGDVSFSKYYSHLKNDHILFDDEVIDFLFDSDYCVCNLEGLFCKNESERTFVHNSSINGINFLAQIKANVWNLANNHVFDNGPAGIEETLLLAQKSKTKTIGIEHEDSSAYEPLIIANEGYSIGILTACYGTEVKTLEGYSVANWDETEKIRNSYNKIKDSCRWHILVLHAGDEFSNIPFPHIRKKFHEYADMGFDIIIGHHPHVVQNYEILPDNKLIFYSLGNFIFDTDYQRVQDYTEQGILLKIVFGESSYSWSYLPVVQDRVNRKIMVGDDIPIFDNIDYKLYKKLLPIVAKNFLISERKRLIFLNQNKAKWTNLIWLVRDIRQCLKDKNYRYIYFLSKLPKQSSGKVIDYIK